MKVHGDTASCMSDYLTYIVSRFIVHVLTVSGARAPQKNCQIGRLSKQLITTRIHVFFNQLGFLPQPDKEVFLPKPTNFLTKT